MSKIFITGGAGFLGINLVRYLLERGEKVVSYDIADFDYPEKQAQNLEVVQGDIRDFAALVKVMAGCDSVVHAAAALPLYKEEDIVSTEVEGTANVLESARVLGIRRVVMISSTAVYGIPRHHPLDEEDPLVGVGPYGRGKILAESLCLDYRLKGMCIPILRPKSFIGPERLGVFALLYDWAMDGRHFPVIGSGNNRYQLLDVYDLCQAIDLVLTLEEDRVNDVFNIGAEVFSTLREDYQAVLDDAGYGKRIKGFWAAPMILTLRLLERLHLSPLYRWVYETAGRDSYVAIDKAKRLLGFKPVYSNQEALIRNYRWYVHHRHEFEHSEGVSHRVPWKQGILGLAKWFF